MPRFDGTGPGGQGPMTGRGNGYCAMRLPGPKQEIDYLRRQARVLEMQLNNIRVRLGELERVKEVHHAGI